MSNANKKIYTYNELIKVDKGNKHTLIVELFSNYSYDGSIWSKKINASELFIIIDKKPYKFNELSFSNNKCRIGWKEILSYCDSSELQFILNCLEVYTDRKLIEWENKKPNSYHSRQICIIMALCKQILLERENNKNKKKVFLDKISLIIALIAAFAAIAAVFVDAFIQK